MKIRLAPLVLAAAATLCTLAPAFATTLGEPQRIAADCEAYTVTFTGTGFNDPGDYIDVTWQIQLVQDGTPILYTGSTRILDTDGPGAPSPVKSVRVPWGIPMCGRTNVVDVAFPPSRFDYVNNFGTGGAGVFKFADGSTSLTLDCPCDITTDICRTPGFWGTHAGTEKKNSRNITQQVIDKVGFLSVCGQSITSTVVKAQNSALEGLCVSPQGEQKLQLARHLTAAALNCVMTSGSRTCANTAIAATFPACDMACQGMPSSMTVSDCMAAIDCNNNGGTLFANGFCKIGTCGGDGVTACDSDKSCLPDPLTGAPVACVPTPGNCHDRLLVNTTLGLNFEPPGPAGSSNACNSANGNTCTIFNCPAK